MFQEKSPLGRSSFADRLNAVSQSVFMASETSFERIERLIEKEKPDFVVIDSIQTVYSELLSSAPGSVSQVRMLQPGF